MIPTLLAIPTNGCKLFRQVLDHPALLRKLDDSLTPSSGPRFHLPHEGVGAHAHTVASDRDPVVQELANGASVGHQSLEFGGAITRVGTDLGVGQEIEVVPARHGEPPHGRLVFRRRVACGFLGLLLPASRPLQALDLANVYGKTGDVFWQRYCPPRPIRAERLNRRLMGVLDALQERASGPEALQELLLRL
eukprot:scaffold5766_cov256-Pinguiococcus_pyrenoidosus.AAC.2